MMKITVVVDIMKMQSSYDFFVEEDISLPSFRQLIVNKIGNTYQSISLQSKNIVLLNGQTPINTDNNFRDLILKGTTIFRATLDLPVEQRECQSYFGSTFQRIFGS